MSGSSSRSVSQSKSSDYTPAEFQELRRPLSDLFQGSFGDTSNYLSGNLQYGGPGDLDRFRAPLGQGELSALDRINYGASNPGQNDRLSSDLLGATLRGDYLSPENNPGLRDLIGYTNQAINDTYNSEGLAQKSLFARAGQVLPESSPFAQAAADLSKSRLDAIGKNVAGLTSQAYEAERGRQVQAIEQRRSDAQFNLQSQLETLKANALPRLIDEVGFERGFAEFNARINALMAVLGLATQSAAPTIAQDSSSHSNSSSGGVF